MMLLNGKEVILVQEVERFKNSPSNNVVSQRELRLNAIIENSPSVLSVKDINGKFLIANKNFDKMLGVPSGEMLGKTVFDFFPNEVAAVISRNDQLVLSSKERHTFEEIVPSSDGQTLVFSSFKFPIFDIEGNIESICSISLDVTAKKQLEKEQAEFRQKLIKANQDKDEFLAVASHELKTPLTTLLLKCQNYLQKVKTGDRSRYEPEKIDRLIIQSEKQILRLARLVDDMLDVSRIQRGKLVVNREMVCLNELVLEVIDQLKMQMETAQTPVIFLAEMEFFGLFDKIRIEQVISNLLLNAKNYGAGRPVQVKLQACNHGKVRLMVIDDGIGISDEFKKRAFNKYERDVKVMEVSGMGLGLYISKQIVDLHDGHIMVESKSRKGSTFIVELPVLEMKSLATH